MRDEKKIIYVSMVKRIIVMIILLPTLLVSQAGRMLSQVPGILAGGVSSAARGGILISMDDELKRIGVDSLAYEQLTSQLTAYFGARSVTIPLESSELAELVYAVQMDSDNTIEISIDPVADRTESYISPELEGTQIGSRLLRLDSDIATLLEGGFRIDSTITNKVSLPSDEVIRLLHPETGDTAYKAIVERYVSPPSSWHSTEIKVGISSDSSQLGVKIKTNPTPVFVTPDGRRLQPEEADQTIASKPYMSLLNHFEEQPEAFVNTMPYLDSALRYARAFSLMLAYKISQDSIWTPSVSYMWPTEEEVLQELIDWQNSTEGVRLAAKRGKLQAAWRAYRLSIKPEDLTNAQRITFFVDEAFAHYRNLAAAKELVSVSPSDPDTLLRFIDGIDLSKEKYGGWALLAKFMVGVWAGEDLDKLIVTMRMAHDAAAESRDTLLLYETLKVTEDLVPVMRSNVFVMEVQGQTPKPVPIPERLKYFMLDEAYSSEVSFSPTVGDSILPNAYLDNLESYVDTAIRDHMVTTYYNLSSKVDSLFTPEEDLAVDRINALKVLQEFEMSHIGEERHRIKYNVADLDTARIAELQLRMHELESSTHPDADSLYIELYSELLTEMMRHDPVLKNLGKIHYALGLVAAKENNRLETLDRARLLNSYSQVAQEELASETALTLKRWSDKLRDISD